MKKHFIIIDDQDVFNILTKKVLENSGISSNISMFNSASEALNFIKKFDKPTDIVILLDIRMPVMDGFEFLNEMHSWNDYSYEKMKIFMLTSSLDEKDIQKASKYKNVLGFYSKPLSPDIIEKIGDFLD